MKEGTEERRGCDALPVVQITVSLDGLGTEVGQVAAEEEVVLRSDGERVAHESDGVDDETAGHGAGDTAEKVSESEQNGKRNERKEAIIRR